MPIRLSSEAPLDHGNSFISELFELTLQTVAESIKMDGCGKCFAGSAFFWIGQKIAGIDPNGAVSAVSVVGSPNDQRHIDLTSEVRAK